ncbi:type II secretion system F family protein [Amycolatopsis magusensis]|uniref:type II secretion system F family protein n=1 Tax=Amycolatopsis magusensis TaxID=882444 RepID=UPI00378AA920
MTAVAVALLAGAVALWPGRTRVPRQAERRHYPRLLPELAAVAFASVLAGVWGMVLAVALVLVARFAAGRPRAPSAADARRLATCWDLLAAALRAGLPVPVAIRAVAPGAPAEVAATLRSTAELLALGADPVEAWKAASTCADTAELARAARRTAKSGAALAGVAEVMAERVRAAMADRTEARAQRAGVLVTGPLGLCFLPAFLCLGLLPLLAGLAGQLL